MNRLIGVTILVVTLMLTGCRFVGAGAATPEEAVLRSRQVPGEANQIQFVGRRELPGGSVIVLYQEMGPARHGVPAMRMMGYYQVTQHPFGWQAGSGGAYGSAHGAEEEELIDMGIGYSNNDNQQYAIAYGQVLVPEVLAVEVTFDDGETIRDVPTNSIFAAVSLSADAVCVVRALDENSEVLKEIVWGAPEVAPGKDNPRPSNNCPPP